MAYNFTVTTYLSQVNITPNAQGQFVIQSTATNINVSTQGTLVQFTSQPATTSTLGAVKIGNGISIAEDGTISVGADNDSNYVTQTVFSNTNVSFFNNDAAYITATDVTNQLGNIRFQGTWIRNKDTGNIYISPQDGQTWVWLPSDSEAPTSPVTVGNVAGGGVQIQTPSAYYTFNTNGITFPDTTVQTTAFLNNIPTALSQLTNDSGFITASAIPTNVSAFTNDSGYLTSSTVAQYIPPAYDQSLNTTDSPTFANLNILGTMTVVNTTVTNKIVVNKETITDTLTFGNGTQQTTAWTGTYSYNNLTDKPTPYTLTTATSNILGGVKIGSGINITEDGTISATTATQYTLPTANTTTIGGVKLAWPQAGIGLDLSGALQIKLNPVNGTGTTASAPWNDSTGFFDLSWNLIPATSSTIGGVKIGDGVSISSSGTISVSTATYTLPVATSATIGGVKGGANILIDTNGTIRQQYSTVYGAGLTSSDGAANTVTGVITRTASVLIATTSSLGGIKIGNGLSINTSTGLTTVSTATTSTIGGVKISPAPAAIATDPSGALQLKLNPINGTGTQAVIVWNTATSTYDFNWNLLPATSSTIGGVIAGNNINIDSNGIISVTFPSDIDNYLVGASGATGISVSTAAQIATISLNTATASILGGVKGGANILIDTNGTIRQQYSTSYGSGLTSSDSAANTVTGVITRTASVLIATSSTLGGIKVGSGLSINSSTGVLSVSFPSYVTSGSNISIFNNDKGYITTSSLAGYSTATAVSELTNDAGYITSSSVPAHGSTAVYARNELPGGTIGMIITISDSGTDTNAPAGNWAPAYWDNDAELWVYIGNSNSVTPV
jgi:hypothetical protein